MTFRDRIRGYLYLIPPVFLFLAGVFGLGRAIYYVIPPITPYLGEYLKGYIALPIGGAIAAAIWWIVITRRDPKLFHKIFMGISLAAVIGFGIAVGLWGLYQRSCFTKLGPMRDYYHCNFSNKDLSQSDIHGSDLTQAVLEGADLNGADLTQADLQNLDLQDARLTNAILSGANLTGVNFTGADLSHVTAIGADLTNADLTNADLQNCVLSQSNLKNTSLSGAKFTSCDLSSANFSDLDLSGAILTEADLSAANLQNVQLEGVDLQGVVFDEADFRDANLAGAILSGASLKGAFLQGADFTEATLHGTNLEQIKASGAIFSGAELQGAILTQADLSGATLISSDMRESILDGADLRNANLEGTNLSGIVFSGVQFEGAKLVRADLSGAGLNQMDLRTVDLSQAILEGADLSAANFSTGEYRSLNLEEANLAGADLSGAAFHDCSFANASLSGVNLTSANFVGATFLNANLEEAIFSGTSVVDSMFEDADCQGLDLRTASFVNTDLAGINLAGADLSGQNLSGFSLDRANLVGARFENANLSNADLSEADIEFANFGNCNLENANFSGQDLTKVEMAGADLEGVNFSSADLEAMYLPGANLVGANLSGANLDNVVLQNANLEDADLSGSSMNEADLRRVDFRGADFRGATLEGALLTYSDFYTASGLTDEMLDSAFGLSNGTYFEPRGEIVSALSGVCRGTGVPGAAPYGGVLGLQPAVLLSESGKDHEWSDNFPSEWEPTGIRFAQLVVCVRPQTTYVVSSTPYCLGTSYCSDPSYLQRHSYQVTVELRRAREGTIVTSQTFYGSPPRSAKQTESWSIVQSGLWGSKVGYSSIESWVKAYVAPRSYSCEDELGCVDIVPSAPIEIGAVFAMSDYYGDLGLDTLRGMEIAEQDIGDVLGHPIRIIELDSACSEDQGEMMAERLVENQWLLGAIGTTCGAPTYAAASVLSQEGMVLISPSVSTAWLTDPEYHRAGFLRVIPNDLEQAKMVAEFAYRELGARTMATIHEGLIYGDSLQERACEVFTSLGGECVAQKEMKEGETDTGQLLNEIATQSPDLIYMAVLMDRGAQLVQQARGMSSLQNVPLIGPDTFFSGYFLELAGGDAKDLYISGLMIGSEFYTPQYDDFLEKYNENYGGTPEGLYHAYGYDALGLLTKAIENAAIRDSDGTLHIPRQALRDALYATNYFYGLTGTLNCTAEGDCGDKNSIRILQIVDTDPTHFNPGKEEDSNPMIVYP